MLTVIFSKKKPSGLCQCANGQGGDLKKGLQGLHGQASQRSKKQERSSDHKPT